MNRHTFLHSPAVGRQTYLNISEYFGKYRKISKFVGIYRKCRDFLIPIYWKGERLGDISDIFDMLSICATLKKPFLLKYQQQKIRFKKQIRNTNNRIISSIALSHSFSQPVILTGIGVAACSFAIFNELFVSLKVV